MELTFNEGSSTESPSSQVTSEIRLCATGMASVSRFRSFKRSARPVEVTSSLGPSLDENTQRNEIF